jgi:hypothetical protein
MCRRVSGDGEASESQKAPGELRLTVVPTRDAEFEDPRVEWGRTRCYTVRAVEIVSGQTFESDGSPPSCKTLVDTFPPRAPREVKVIATAGAMSLIWDPNTEPDLAGYLVLRGVWPGDRLEPITPEPIQEATYTDMVMPGTRYVYAVRAVDRAGNASPLSERVDETAR